jgi:periplasmic protein TonB
MSATHIQLVSAPSFGSGGRLVLALLLSINFHLYLVYGIASGGVARFRSDAPALHARIELMPEPEPALPVPSPKSANDPPRPEAPMLVLPQLDRHTLFVEDSRRDIPLARESAGPAPPPPAPAPEPSPAAATHTAAFAPPLESRYFAASEIDRYPKLLHKVTPPHPSSARETSGVVTLQLLIDETGKVAGISVVNADPPHLFDQSAMDAFLPARFSPAQIAGEAVRSKILVKVRFVSDPLENSSK